MSLTLRTRSGQSYAFDGPFTDIGNLRKQSGVYSISTKANNGLHDIIDIGESQDVQTRVSNHDRSHLWKKYAIDTLYVSALYCDEKSRMIIEQQLRESYVPPAGDR